MGGVRRVLTESTKATPLSILPDAGHDPWSPPARENNEVIVVDRVDSYDAATDFLFLIQTSAGHSLQARGVGRGRVQEDFMARGICC